MTVTLSGGISQSLAYFNNSGKQSLSGDLDKIILLTCDNDCNLVIIT